MFGFFVVVVLGAVFFFFMPGLRKLYPALCDLSLTHPARQPSSGPNWGQMTCHGEQVALGTLTDPGPSGPRADSPVGKGRPFCGGVREGLQGFWLPGRAALSQWPVLPPAGGGHCCATNSSPQT